ncbi:hypothetical protein MNV49_004159 [Pseudohyphozyma bogoriensis]|nr:hypothetical protein MNV49_004159 [Pseudohyphozyma bogoriensis]
MPGGGTFSITGLRLPFSPGPSASTRLRSGGGLLTSWSAGDAEQGNLGRRRRRPRIGFRLTVRRIVHLILISIALIVFVFFYKYTLHIEIQRYSRGWIKREVLPTPALSPTCFLPGYVAKTSYNRSLAAAPALVDIQAGMRLDMGEDCFNFAATLPKSPLPGMRIPQRTVFHTYWRADLLPLGKRHVALIHSILSMQDRASTSVILWTNEAVASHMKNSILLTPLIELYGDRFSVQTVDKALLSKGTPMERSPLLDMSDKKAWLDGDLIRVLVLWAHGGIWVDMDTIMTGRDMRVLEEHEWVTQWDCYDKPYQPLNGAMMHFYQNSPFLCEMLYTMANDPPPKKGSTDWGSHLYQKVWRRLVANGVKPFKILPYCFTDGRNCRLNNRLPDPFAKQDISSWGKGRAEQLKKKVESVWAVHLHNQWDKEFPSGGWVKTIILDKVSKATKKYRQKVSKGAAKKG